MVNGVFSHRSWSVQHLRFRLLGMSFYLLGSDAVFTIEPGIITVFTVNTLGFLKYRKQTCLEARTRVPVWLLPTSWMSLGCHTGAMVRGSLTPAQNPQYTHRAARCITTARSFFIFRCLCSPPNLRLFCRGPITAAPCRYLDAASTPHPERSFGV